MTHRPRPIPPPLSEGCRGIRCTVNRCAEEPRATPSEARCPADYYTVARGAGGAQHTRLLIGCGRDSAVCAGMAIEWRAMRHNYFDALEGARLATPSPARPSALPKGRAGFAAGESSWRTESVKSCGETTCSEACRTAVKGRISPHTLTHHSSRARAAGHTHKIAPVRGGAPT